MTESTQEAREDATAQDVIDALRMAFVAQSDLARMGKIAEAMIDLAPETDSNRGIDLLLKLLAEGSLRVEMVERP